MTVTGAHPNAASHAATALVATASAVPSAGAVQAADTASHCAAASVAELAGAAGSHDGLGRGVLVVGIAGDQPSGSLTGAEGEMVLEPLAAGWLPEGADAPPCGPEAEAGTASVVIDAPPCGPDGVTGTGAGGDDTPPPAAGFGEGEGGGVGFGLSASVKTFSDIASRALKGWILSGARAGAGARSVRPVNIGCVCPPALSRDRDESLPEDGSWEESSGFVRIYIDMGLSW